MLFPIFCYYQQFYVNILMRFNWEVASKYWYQFTWSPPLLKHVFLTPSSMIAIISLLHFYQYIGYISLSKFAFTRLPFEIKYLSIRLLTTLFPFLTIIYSDSLFICLFVCFYWVGGSVFGGGEENRSGSLDINLWFNKNVGMFPPSLSHDFSHLCFIFCRTELLPFA